MLVLLFIMHSCLRMCTMPTATFQPCTEIASDGDCSNGLLLVLLVCATGTLSTWSSRVGPSPTCTPTSQLPPPPSHPHQLLSLLLRPWPNRERAQLPQLLQQQLRLPDPHVHRLLLLWSLRWWRSWALLCHLMSRSCQVGHGYQLSRQNLVHALHAWTAH